jgi:hypothetical protein
MSVDIKRFVTELVRRDESVDIDEVSYVDFEIAAEYHKFQWLLQR